MRLFIFLFTFLLFNLNCKSFFLPKEKQKDTALILDFVFNHLLLNRDSNAVYFIHPIVSFRENVPINEINYLTPDLRLKTIPAIDTSIKLSLIIPDSIADIKLLSINPTKDALLKQGTMNYFVSPVFYDFTLKKSSVQVYIISNLEQDFVMFLRFYYIFDKQKGRIVNFDMISEYDLCFYPNNLGN